MSHAMTWGDSPTSDDKMWGMVAHLSSFIFPFLGPLALYLIFKESGRFVKYHAVQSLVFQIAGWIIDSVTCGFGFILFFLPLWIGYRAFQGEWAGYPLLEGVGKD